MLKSGHYFYFLVAVIIIINNSIILAFQPFQCPSTQAIIMVIIFMPVKLGKREVCVRIYLPPEPSSERCSLDWATWVRRRTISWMHFASHFHTKFLGFLLYVSAGLGSVVAQVDDLRCIS